MHANRTTAWLCGLSFGAAAMALLDPTAGGRRRARIRDKFAWSARKGREAYEATRRDVENRLTGLAARARSVGDTEEVDDSVLEARVRSTLGRYVSHPAPLDVIARNGFVTLAGPILTDEADRVLAAVRQVRGVRSVDDQMDRHDESGSEPALQGGATRSHPRSAFMQERWSPTARLVAGSAGLALLLIGMRRPGLVGGASAATGVALLTRGVADTELRGLGAWAGSLLRIP